MVPTVRSSGNGDNNNLNGEDGDGGVSPVVTNETEMVPLNPNTDEASQDFNEDDTKCHA